MKIAYFELGFTSFYEDYSTNPKGYGGGPVFARWAKELLNDENNLFVIFGPKECFQNLSDGERKDRCIALPEDGLKALRNKAPLDSIIGGLEDFDLVVHHHTCETINMGNLRMPLVHWSGFGRGDAGHPNNDYILLYTPGEKSCFGEKYKYIKIGKPVPKEFIKKISNDGDTPFVFQCSRHDDHMNTIEVAKNCLKHKIHGIFAGPIHNNYPLMDFIDNKTTFYLGAIDEKTKLEYTKKATLTTYLHKWETVFNQSVIESWSVGTPILANNVGFFKQVLKHGVNGFVYDGNNFKEAFEAASSLKQEDCWKSAREFSVEEMVASFKKAFEEIIHENRKMKNLEKTIEILKELPRPLVGSLAFDHKDIFNLRLQCVEMMKEVMSIANPKEILEIGTHLGHSGCLLLSFSDANLTTVDIGTNWVEMDYGYSDWGRPNAANTGLNEVVRVMKKHFGERYRFFKGSSVEPETIAKFSDRKYDLAFIDGDHSYEFVKKDIQTAIALNIPYILLDDFTGDEAPCRVAAKELGLVQIKEFFGIHNTANISCGLFSNPHVK